MADLVPRLPRVEALIGHRLAELNEAALEKLVTSHVPEDADIEFKRDVYEQSDRGHQAAAGDVAAMANSPGGGAIFLGIRDEDSGAAEVVPVAFSDVTEGRLNQAIVSLTAPAPQFVIRRIPMTVDADRGVYLIVVPPSPYAPHAVRSGARLAYPRRSGPHTRYLSESEVAEAYRSRFVTAEARHARLGHVRAAGEGMLSHGSAWLSTSLVPAVPGNFGVTVRSLAELANASARWYEPGFATHIFRDHPHAEAAVRRVVIFAGRQPDSHLSTSGHAELHVDGSAFAATVLSPVERHENKSGTASVDDEWLVEAAIATVGLCVEFASDRSGAVGDAYVAISLEAGNAAELFLTHARQFGAHQRFEGGRSALGGHVSTAYVNLEDASTPLGRVIVARMLLTEVFQWFGYPEVLQITEDGHLRRPYIAHHNRVAAEAWAVANGIEFVDTLIGQDN